MSDISILLADDQAIIRDGLKIMLNMEENFNVVGTCENGRLIHGFIDQISPKVVLMDILMQGELQIETIRQLKQRYRDIVIIVLTTIEDDEIILQTLAAGASGYFLKNMPSCSFMQAIRDCVNGNVSLPLSISIKLTNKLFNLSSKLQEKEKICIMDLSDREKEIAQLMVQGLSNKRIASVFYITEGTVKNYISNIYSKIGINDRTQAVLYLRQLGMQ
ncbi:LuxR C-terminal-related transcriptional regulator [Clostridium omnivorum]|uniref:Stage 0 sporulation protein A homolog n=1 Tax=Clostridium omnivorum TaxID=1604902 RepID=A0ABQ5N1U7_9CLOT|nr:response regulator transcription factor [Clostridium sp. E14]GLC29165.1 DNA-binding response regulator [Clostridium sp. E14]